MNKYVESMKNLDLNSEYRRNTLRHLILEFFNDEINKHFIISQFCLLKDVNVIGEQNAQNAKKLTYLEDHYHKQLNTLSLKAIKVVIEHNELSKN